MNATTPFMQNRELSWLSFNERVLDMGNEDSLPILERLNFVSIYWSNLQEFFMVRVGSITDLSLLKQSIIDTKTGWTPAEQLSAIYARCAELYPIEEQIFKDVCAELDRESIHHLLVSDLNEEQTQYLETYLDTNVIPLLSPQIVNAQHPFPHLENGMIHVVVRLDEEMVPAKQGKKAKTIGAEGVTLGIIPLPRQCERIIKLPGEGFFFILMENALEYIVPRIFSMYKVKHTNVICVTRNADLDTAEGIDEADEDYREHMKRILRRRSRLAAVRLESKRQLSETVEAFLLERLSLEKHQAFATSVPLDMSYTFELASHLSEKQRARLTYPPFTPQWPASLSRNESIIEQVSRSEHLLSYPYESIDPFIQLLKEASTDPRVISIKITLYRLASQSHLAEALIAAAENGKEVTALFELRARFDESNNIEWSQRFEQAGAKVIYGFKNYKVHSKICCITLQADKGLQHITQLGTGNYNEKTAKLYTDLSFITTDESIGRDATEFFRNMGLETISENYDILSVAPLQIKPMILESIDLEIEKAQRSESCGVFFKTNSITDKDIILKLSEASCAGVPVTLFVRGISCIIPGIEGYTDTVRVVSVIGRLLEHSRVYGFGPMNDMRIYLSSADLMTRNMDKRIEIAWPVLNNELRNQIIDYLKVSLRDTAKRRELKPDTTYTPLGYFVEADADGKTAPFDSQEHFIRQAQKSRLIAAAQEADRKANEPSEDKVVIPATVNETHVLAKQEPEKQGFFARLLAFLRKG